MYIHEDTSLSYHKSNFIMIIYKTYTLFHVSCLVVLYLIRRLRAYFSEVKSMLRYVTLCCAVRCCAALCYVTLRYVTLRYVILYDMICYVMLCYVMLCYVMLCYVMLCYVMLCYVQSAFSNDMMILIIRVQHQKINKRRIHFNSEKQKPS